MKVQEGDRIVEVNGDWTAMSLAILEPPSMRIHFFLNTAFLSLISSSVAERSAQELRSSKSGTLLSTQASKRVPRNSLR